MSEPLLRIFRNSELSKETRRQLLLRESGHDTKAIELVEKIVSEVESRGEKAVLEYTEQFDGICLPSLFVLPSDFEQAEAALSSQLKDAFWQAAQNIRSFHELQRESLEDKETLIDGSRLGFRYEALQAAGIYVPGGKARYPSSVLMGLIPANVAGVKETVLITPPTEEGGVDPAVLFCAKIAGCKHVLKSGGAQGVAAAAFGLAGRKLDIIVGPGNRYVTQAKNLLAGRGLIRIDSPAGPSEVLVIADNTARADFVAADMLSQAEHGSDSPAILLTNHYDLAAAVAQEIERGLDTRSKRREMKETSIRKHSFVIVYENLNDAFVFANEYAAEHLEICTQNPEADFQKITSAGSVFLGHYAPVALGDYYSGTNHVLPTGGAARFYSGLGVETFLKRITWQYPSKESLQKALQPIRLMSEHEGFDEEHGHSIEIRFADYLAQCGAKASQASSVDSEQTQK